jgi:hypothetical protein
MICDCLPIELYSRRAAVFETFEVPGQNFHIKKNLRADAPAV